MDPAKCRHCEACFVTWIPWSHRSVVHAQRRIREVLPCFGSVSSWRCADHLPSDEQNVDLTVLQIQDVFVLQFRKEIVEVIMNILQERVSERMIQVPLRRHQEQIQGCHEDHATGPRRRFFSVSGGYRVSFAVRTVESGRGRARSPVSGRKC